MGRARREIGARELMKTLLILRHAKSSWKKPVADHDRPLNKRGKSDAPRMGKVLRDADLAPDLIISSTAERARETAAKVAQHSGYAGAVELSSDLYLAGPDGYRRVLRGVSDALERVLVVGHNPGAEMLLESLTGRSETLPTAALAQVRLEIEHWSDLDDGAKGVLVELWRPRMLA
jgi:phosphohistidine phosphatase